MIKTVTKEEVQTYLETAPARALRQYALVASRVLTERQLKILDKYFSQKLEFDIPENEALAQDLMVETEDDESEEKDG